MSQSNGTLSRRDVLKLMGSAGAVSILGATLGPQALAQADAGGKFLVYIHAGAWDGLAAGLLQPREADRWQRGLFLPGQDGESANPNINVHHKVGELILNNYTKPLSTIANHVCFGVATPRSLNHDDARMIQTTGGKDPGTFPSWVNGFAQALFDQKPGMTIVTTRGSQAERARGKTAKDVTLVEGTTFTGYRASFDDAATVPKGEHANRFWGILKTLGKGNFGVSSPDPQAAANLASYIDNLVVGQPQLADTAPAVTGVKAAFNRAAVNAQIDNATTGITAAHDGEGVKTRPYDDLLEFLQLCGALAKLGLARGASMALDLQDLHGGGSSVITARSGAQVFAQLAAFWKGYVIPNGLADKMMIVVSHEFSRTPYNNASTTANVIHNGAEVAVRSPGTDHQLVTGFVFLNGNVPGAKRIGGIGDFYTALGSKTLAGVGATDVAAYTSTRLVGSMLMRCFPDVFPNERAVRQSWGDFTPIEMVIA